SDPYLQGVLRTATEHLKRGDAPAAARQCERLLRARPDSVQARLFYSQLCQQMGDFDRMRELAEDAVRLAPSRISPRLRLVECLFYCGDIRAARERLARLESLAGDDPKLWHQVAELHVHCGQHHEAHRCHQRGVDLAPDEPRYLYNLASSAVAIGELEKAEELYERVLALDPQDWDAWQNRSTLRKWSDGNNHVATLERLLDDGPSPHPGEVALCYALAKELEDLGDDERSWHYLERGAKRRRAQMRYRVEGDVATLNAIRQAFDAQVMQKAPERTSDAGPIFVLGLPRSGTTLVDRILSSHPQVDSLGEINALAFAVMHGAGFAPNKAELVRQSAGMDHALLGRRYLEATRGYGLDAPSLLDKTPLNFLYLGLIRLALPSASVVHLRRHPLDSVFAMYKTLFRMGYPFSYDLDDLAQYYLAYRRLMAHWREVCPGALHDLDYEALVTDPEPNARALLAHCGLDWNDRCLAFHRNPAPAATASAAQVRQPIYTSSVGRWKVHAERLAPVAEKLHAAGIDVD
ncbi:MAG: sulfotransferase, partial [Xanthomonadales bacterium]|nr:sulfotransferase [Xanthomonadales bacterium]